MTGLPIVVLTVLQALTPVQCRRLLKIGRPFKWQPPKDVGIEVLRDMVRAKLEAGGITNDQWQATLAPKPKKAGVTRRCEHCTVRDRSKLRVPIWTVYPNGTIALRLEGTRQVEYTTMPAVFAMAVRQRVNAERAQKKGKSK